MGRAGSEVGRGAATAEESLPAGREKENDSPQAILCSDSKVCLQIANATFAEARHGVRSPGSEGEVPARTLCGALVVSVVPVPTSRFGEHGCFCPTPQRLREVLLANAATNCGVCSGQCRQVVFFQQGEIGKNRARERWGRDQCRRPHVGTATRAFGMKIKLKMLSALAAALASFFIIQVPAANADVIKYQVTGVGPDLGTNFTYVSPGGFLTASNFPIVPTTATDLFVGGIDKGAISSIILTGGGKQLEYIAVGANYVFVDAGSGSITFPTSTGTFTNDVLGTQTGTLVITDLSVATPEPGSVSLLLIGLGSLGLMMVMRKRITEQVT